MNVEALNLEIEKRRNSNKALLDAEEATKLAIQQYTQLDIGFKDEADVVRSRLETFYLELRHYTGNWVVVYDENLVDKYPYYNGETDDKCNPYFRMTAVQAGDPGISPIEATVDRTTPANYARKRTYTNESDVRSDALSALNAYPDHTYEDTTPTIPPDPDPVWDPSLTATGLLKTALGSWNDSLELLVVDTYDSQSTVDYWQMIVDEIATCISLLPPEATYPNQTPNPSGPLLSSINKLKVYAGTNTDNIVSQRTSILDPEAVSNENIFFGLIGLRMHFINGSYSKLKAADGNQGTNASLIEDNKKAILTLTNIIISQ